MRYEPVIGLETHVELAAASKVFCSCKAEFGGEPNTHVCPVCLGLPGTLPVLNRESVAMALKVCLAMDCDIPEVTIFDRKNYYYPDLPKNYQISQEYEPLARNGGLTIVLKDGTEKYIRMHNIHLEEDAGKNFHPTGTPRTLVDLNRASTSLLEIVSQPDIRGAEECEAYMETMRSLLRYLEVSDCKMQEGSLRFELNISLRPAGTEPFGTKVEVKNVGSIKAVLRALDYEIRRQTEILEDGGRVIQETRLWDDDRGETRSMRVKEGAKDYRYFPEPDLVPLRLEKQYLADLKAHLPELQTQKRKRFVEQYELPDYDAGVIVADKYVAEFFETCCQAHPAPKAFSNWIMVYILRELKDEDSDIRELGIKPAHLIELVQLIEKGTINQNIAKKLIAEIIPSGTMPSVLVKEKCLEVVSDSSELEKFVDEVITEQPGPAEDFRNGKDQALNFLLGQVMRKSRGQATPETVRDMLIQKLRG
ncbi:MAG: Asp-tRNA(Asn)/Glu-tRNA(Gln) amidotransferase subunit GatB [bacterium]|jgi:aspartyl-tRNA(Asn)/glutamyl-tRNA(Gln) amidotransferase subunit B|nr:Asp-tRNA(Asn)/Glu-tRNA(Gln) amidotransferase subunit GatB [bacterium]